jgi:CRP-like cAMP-binding protein
MDESTYLKFKTNQLLKGLEEEEIRTLFSYGKKVCVRTGDYLMQEGDEAKDLFFVLDGYLEIAKKDLETSEVYSIAQISPGDVVGEVALLDRGSRSASVVARQDAELISIPFSVFGSQMKDNDLLYKVFLSLIQNISSRLRQMSDKIFKSFQANILEYKNRLFLGRIFVINTCFICLYIYFLHILENVHYFNYLLDMRYYFSLPLTICFLSGMAYFVKCSQIPLKMFGLTTERWKKSLYEGFVFTLPLLVAIPFLKWAFIHFHILKGDEDSIFQWRVTTIPVLAYLLLVVPMQEFMARGGLQGMLAQLLTGKYRTFLAILVSSLLFGIVHLFLSVTVSLLSLLVSFYFGWLYARTPNLLGVCVAHAMVGIWGLGIVGF